MGQLFKNAAQKLRLRNKKSNNLPPVDKIPVIIPKDKFDTLNVEGSYEFVESIAVPSEGTGGIYTKDYFQSLLDYMKEYPIPGSKDGHESQGDDFYTIGGELQLTSETEGVCNLRILVPPDGWNSSNAALIRSLKTGIPELSIVADVEPTRGNDGRVYFTKELGRPRNDIVPEGAMDVTINSLDEKEIMALIEKGAIDMFSESTELVKNGKVFRKAAVNLQSTSDKALAGRVLNAIANRKKSKFRRNGMKKFYNEAGEEIAITYEDVIAWLKNAITNNQLTTEQLVADLGMGNKLRKSEDDEALKEAEDLKEAIVEALHLPEDTPAEKLVELVEEVLEEADKAQETVVEATANELAGGKTIRNEKGEDVSNPVFVYAMKNLKGKRGKQLNEAAEALKKDEVMIALRSKQADSTTSVVSKDSTPASTIREV